MSEDFPKIDDDAVQKAEAKLREYEVSVLSCRTILGLVFISIFHITLPQKLN